MDYTIADENSSEQLDENNELYEHFKIVADKGQALMRIDKFLLNRIENVSRNKIQQTAKAGNIHVNGSAVKQNYKVRPADVVTVVFSYPPREIEITPEDIPLEIVYEDQDVIVINKQYNLVVHPGHGNYSGTLLNALAHYFKQTDQAVENGCGYLAHRIDKDTTGLLIIAKNELAQAVLARQFYEHSIERKYQALIWGTPKEETGTITGHIGRSLKNRKVMDVFPDGNYGKEAITHYRILEHFGYVTLVECQLETGRTHQIRAHMRHIGHPLFNDVWYGGDKILKGTSFTKYKQFIENCFKILPRHALHAKSLGFKHPTTGKHIFFESELPSDMLNVIEKWRSYTASRDNE
ncbi:MAG: RluA family pseudouridine synthase [Bacteroidales bacterium]|jgi:23S rRNA pseudouridine1911/1915/1917 synthase|nr:RluA family pseudouridine synthase [Bacteroidales bacterium]MDN5348733.1 rRNA synthase [Bacteroidales bacterium]